MQGVIVTTTSTSRSINHLSLLSRTNILELSDSIDRTFQL